MEKDVLKAADIAVRLGVSRSRVYQLIRDGVIPNTRIGKALRVPTVSWETWLASQAEAATASVKTDNQES